MNNYNKNYIEPEIMTSDEVKEFLRIGRTKLQELYYTEGFPAYKIGRRWYVNKANLVEWLDEKISV